MLHYECNNLNIYCYNVYCVLYFIAYLIYHRLSWIWDGFICNNLFFWWIDFFLSIIKSLQYIIVIWKYHLLNWIALGVMRRRNGREKTCKLGWCNPAADIRQILPESFKHPWLIWLRFIVFTGCTDALKMYWSRQYLPGTWYLACRYDTAPLSSGVNQQKWW